MDDYLKNRVIMSILIILGGTISLSVYLAFPFDRQFIMYNIAIIFSMVICIGGGVSLLLSFTRKLPALKFSLVTLIMFGIGGIVFLIGPFIDPNFFSLNILIVIENFEMVSFHTWLYVEERKTKELS